MSSKGKLAEIVGMLDINDDGQVDVWDMTHLVVRHEFMFIAGVFIFIGSIGNVIGWWNIDSDAYWAAAGLATMLEYVDDTRRIRKAKKDDKK